MVNLNDLSNPTAGQKHSTGDEVGSSGATEKHGMKFFNTCIIHLRISKKKKTERI